MKRTAQRWTIYANWDFCSYGWLNITNSFLHEHKPLLLYLIIYIHYILFVSFSSPLLVGSTRIIHMSGPTSISYDSCLSLAPFTPWSSCLANTWYTCGTMHCMSNSHVNSFVLCRVCLECFGPGGLGVRRVVAPLFVVAAPVVVVVLWLAPLFRLHSSKVVLVSPALLVSPAPLDFPALLWWESNTSKFSFSATTEVCTN